MRSYAFLVAGSAALAYAQSSADGSGVPEIPTPTNVDPAASSAAAAINSCLRDCDDDLTCQAACISVPAPNESQANANTQCAEDCDQGEGSEEDIQAYGECLAQCAAEHYFSAGEGTPRPTGTNDSDDDDDEDSETTTTTASDADATNSDEPSGSDSPSESDSDDASSTGDAEESEESGDSEDSDDDDSAATTVLAGSALGLFGFVAAFFL